MKPSPLILVAVFLGTLVSPNANAQWAINGVAPCSKVGAQQAPAIASDGAGGAIIAWGDASNGSYDIYASRIAPTGNTVWCASICTAAGDQFNPRIIADGAGGAIMVWEDVRNATWDIFAQLVDASGKTVWTNNGVAVCTATGTQERPVITSNGAGGAIMAWEDSRGGNADIYAARYDYDGKRAWTTNGVALCTAANGQLIPSIASDGAGGAIVTWMDKRIGTVFTDDVYARRVSNTGTALWTADGVAVSTAGNNQNSPVVISDGAGGGIIAWQDRRSSRDDIYAQRINSSGTSQWLSNGVALCTAAFDQDAPRIVSDGSGGAVVTWSDLRNGYSDVYARRIDNTGTPMWTADGVALCTMPEIQTVFAMTTDGSGGAIVVWEDARDPTRDIYARRVDSVGNPQWMIEGSRVCTWGGEQLGPVIVSGAAGDAIIAWNDYRTGTPQVYAQRMSAAGEWVNTPVGSDVSVNPGDENGNGSPLWVTFASIAQEGLTSLVMTEAGPDLPGSFTLGDSKYYHLTTTATSTGLIYICIQYDEASLTVPEASLRMLHYDTELIPPAWVDVTADLDTDANQICGWTDHLSPFAIGAGTVTGVPHDDVPLAFALHTNIPNPFNPITTIGYEIPAGGADVSISIYDVSGRRVRELVNEHRAAGMWSVTWNGDDDRGQRVASGVYFYRMRAGEFIDTKKMVLLK